MYHLISSLVSFLYGKNLSRRKYVFVYIYIRSMKYRTIYNHILEFKDFKLYCMIWKHWILEFEKLNLIYKFITKLTKTKFLKF